MSCQGSELCALWPSLGCLVSDVLGLTGNQARPILDLPSLCDAQLPACQCCQSCQRRRRASGIRQTKTKTPGKETGTWTMPAWFAQSIVPSRPVPSSRLVSSRLVSSGLSSRRRSRARIQVSKPKVPESQIPGWNIPVLVPAFAPATLAHSHSQHLHSTASRFIMLHPVASPSSLFTFVVLRTRFFVPIDAAT